MPAAAFPSRRKARRRCCILSCLAPSAVYDSDDSPAKRPEKVPVGSPDFTFCARVRRQSKTVPLSEEICFDGEARVAEGGEIELEISPAANLPKGMPEKFRKLEKRCKITGTKPFTNNPLPTCSNKRSDNQHPGINNQPKATLRRRDPVQTRTTIIHPGSSDPTRPICSTRTHPSPDMLTGLKMLAIILLMILIAGKLFAVFIATACFYFPSYVGQTRTPVLLMASARKNHKKAKKLKQ